MEFQKGQVAVSLAGHDKGELLVITGFDGKRVFICDGKSRRLESPKLKNPKHIEKTSHFLSEDSMATNRKLRKQLIKIATYGG